MQKPIDWINLNKEEILNNVKEFLKIPSISSDKSYENYMIKAAQWVKNNFERIGLETKLLESKGCPVVFAQTQIDQNKPTILCYFHYDVQPVGDLELWENHPFEPIEKENKIFGRGTTDDKMQGLIHTFALESFLKTSNELPVNFQFCIEGEEEISSPNVMDVIIENRNLFKPDYIIISDGPMLTTDLPSIEVGTRGILYTQIRVSIGKKDLHSGQFGGYVKNANFELIKIINSLKNEKGQIVIPGFYDDVIIPEKNELESWNLIPKTENEYLNDSQVYELDKGEEGYSLLERNWSRPVMDVNGIWGGFMGEGAKTVIPHEAFAKISFRLVPNQNPKDIEQKFINYINTFNKNGVEVEVQWTELAEPYLSTSTDKIFEKAINSYEGIFPNKTLLTRTGGTIGLLSDLKKVFDKPILLMNFGSPDENMHAPNEFMRIDNFFKGIEVSINLISSFE